MARQPDTARTATAEWKRIRNKVVTRARHQGLTNCPNCHVELVWSGPRQPNSVEVDHIIPIHQGGTDELDNLTVLCGTCNRAKGGRHAPQPTRRRTQTQGKGSNISTGNISYLWGPDGPLYKPTR